jgi:hypothetical protein
VGDRSEERENAAWFHRGMLCCLFVLLLLGGVWLCFEVLAAG